MIASSSNFVPHPGWVIRDLFHLLNAVSHHTEALIYSNYPREATASSYLAIIFVRIASGVSWFLCPTEVPMQLLYQCKHALMLAMVALKQPAIGCLTLCFSIWKNGAIVTALFLLLYCHLNDN